MPEPPLAFSAVITAVRVRTVPPLPVQNGIEQHEAATGRLKGPTPGTDLHAGNGKLLANSPNNTIFSWLL